MLFFINFMLICKVQSCIATIISLSMSTYYMTSIIININELANQFLWKIMGRVVLSGKPIYSEICMFNVVHVVFRKSKTLMKHQRHPGWLDTLSPRNRRSCIASYHGTITCSKWRSQWSDEMQIKQKIVSSYCSRRGGVEEVWHSQLELTPKTFAKFWSDPWKPLLKPDKTILNRKIHLSSWLYRII